MRSIFTERLCSPAFPALHNRALHHALDKAIAHVRQRRVAVEPCLRLHLNDAMLQKLLLVLIQPERLRSDCPRPRSASPRRSAPERRFARHGRQSDAPRRECSGVPRDSSSQKSVTFGSTLPRDVAMRPDAPARKRPRPSAAAIGTTGMPSDSLIFRTSMEPPLARTSSIMFSASTIGTRSSRSCSVRYRLRSMLVASTMLMMPSGFWLRMKVAGDDFLLRIGPQRVDARQINHRAALFPAHLAAFSDPPSRPENCPRAGSSR